MCCLLALIPADRTQRATNHLVFLPGYRVEQPTKVILTVAKILASVGNLPPKDGNVRGHMKVPRFDIFSGTDKHAQWIEVVEGLAAASRRMEFHAAKRPGKYFIFNCSEHTIADSTDTSFRNIGPKYGSPKTGAMSIRPARPRLISKAPCGQVGSSD